MGIFPTGPRHFQSLAIDESYCHQLVSADPISSGLGNFLGVDSQDGSLALVPSFEAAMANTLMIFIPRTRYAVSLLWELVSGFTHVKCWSYIRREEVLARNFVNKDNPFQHGTRIGGRPILCVTDSSLAETKKGFSQILVLGT